MCAKYMNSWTYAVISYTLSKVVSVDEVGNGIVLMSMKLFKKSSCTKAMICAFRK